MKKISARLHRWSLLLLLNCAPILLTAQSRNSISIAVNEVEYDDVGLVSLKESLQKNKKVAELKQSYEERTAKISLLYTGSATSLWEEIPKASKDHFRLTSIDDNHIAISNKSAATPSSNSKATSTEKATSANPTDKCSSCYWKLCNYDVLKTFQGKVYMGINYDDGTYYFNCDNGMVVQKKIIVNGYGVTTNIETDTLVIFGAPVGTKWKVINDDVSILGMRSKEQGSHTLIAKGINTRAKDINYKDVVVINVRSVSYNSLFGSGDLSVNDYYARGVGLIRSDTLSPSSDPVAAINKTAGTSNVYTAGGDVKNGIDESIVGIWKYKDPANVKEGYYKFNQDGTFEYYTGAVTAANQYKGIHHWKIEEGGWRNGSAVLDLQWEGQKTPIRYELQKKKDPSSGKQAIMMNEATFVWAGN